MCSHRHAILRAYHHSAIGDGSTVSIIITTKFLQSFLSTYLLPCTYFLFFFEDFSNKFNYSQIYKILHIKIKSYSSCCINHSMHTISSIKSSRSTLFSVSLHARRLLCMSRSTSNLPTTPTPSPSPHPLAMTICPSLL